MNKLLIRKTVFLHRQAIRTPRLEHAAQFDLMKEVRVRVYTVLSGPCTGGSVVKSSRYTELVQKPTGTGQGTDIRTRDLETVFRF